jgi:hypothetical protein
MNFESYEEESAMKTISFYCCKFCCALLKLLGTEVKQFLLSLISVPCINNISLKGGFNKSMLRKWFREIGEVT